MKVVSLLFAATEIVYGLGIGDELVAVSHDCDYPEQVDGKPRITRCETTAPASPAAKSTLHQAQAARTGHVCV